jgi:hypothetical protein
MDKSPDPRSCPPIERHAYFEELSQGVVRDSASSTAADAHLCGVKDVEHVRDRPFLDTVTLTRTR